MNEENKDKKEKKKSDFMENIKVIIAAVIIALIVRNFIFNLAVVNQTSMYPTLYPKDVVVVNRTCDWRDKFNRGDIIIFKSPEDSKKLIKRIIGLPDEKITIKDGVVFVNGKELEEDYLQEDVYTDTYEKDTWVLGKNEYFCMGDNRPGSYDCRNFGPIKRSYLIGSSNYRIFPLKSFGKIDK